MTVKEAIQKRKATKRYKDGKEITDAQIATLIDAAHLAPSANNLQNSKIIVVKSTSARKEYAQGFEGFNQLNINQSQVLFILIGTPWKMEMLNNGQRIYDADIHAYNVSEEKKREFVNGIMTYYARFSGYADSLDIYSSAIQFSFMVLQATELGFDSTPMLGIKKDTLEKFLLDKGDIKQGERVNMAFTIGYADTNAPENKLHGRIRVPKEQMYKIV